MLIRSRRTPPAALIRSALALVLLPLLSQVQGSEALYPATGGNVTFAEVQALAFAEPDATLPYANVQPGLQYGALWLPRARSPGQSAPLLIFIHGGCWMNAFDLQHTRAFATALAAAGYAVWSLEYRRTGDAGGGWPGTFEDVMAGVGWRDQLAEHGVDSTHFIVMGHSAGGHLALLAGGRTPQARAVIGLAAIVDLVEYAAADGSCQAAARAFMGADPLASPATYAAANPATLPLHRNSYLLQSAQDDIVPLATTPVPGTRSLIANGAGHFDWVHPGTPAFRELLALLDGLLER